MPPAFLPMNFLSQYSLPLAIALLLSVFFISLPDLRYRLLAEADKERYKLGRADAFIMAIISLVYGALAFYRLGNTQSPESFVSMENKTA